MADHPTLHLHDAPFDTSGVGPDLVHLTDDAYAAYAASLQALLADEIGLSGGTIDGTTQSFGLATEVEGGAAGDWILGTAAGDLIRGGGGNDIVDGRGGDDTIEGQDGRDRIAGGAGADQVAGGADADTFVYNTDFADGTSAADAILDFGLGADRLVLADAFEGAVTVTDIAGGVRLAVGGFGTIEVFGAQADALKGADLGGGSFALTTDADLVTYFAESMLSL
ncbi:hypothetical protein K3554_00605 [Jannaschia sp. W003]|nr:hypothetical protein K3554_00605 [Jannaschia sp. W003]